jgi:hypothetical protein
MPRGAFLSGFDREFLRLKGREFMMAEYLPEPLRKEDAEPCRSAYSCGAVAELHRLPEHPDDCRGELNCVRQQ